MKSNRSYLRQINYRTFKKHYRSFGNYGSSFTHAEWELQVKELLQLKPGDLIWNYRINAHSKITKVVLEWNNISKYCRRKKRRRVAGFVLNGFRIETDAGNTLYDTPSFALYCKQQENK